MKRFEKPILVTRPNLPPHFHYGVPIVSLLRSCIRKELDDGIKT